MQVSAVVPGLGNSGGSTLGELFIDCDEVSDDAQYDSADSSACRSLFTDRPVFGRQPQS